MGQEVTYRFQCWENQLVLFHQYNNIGANDVKVDGLALEKKSSFKMLELTFSSEFDWSSCIVSIANNASRKIGALILSMKFLPARLLCRFINLPHRLAWNTVVIFGIELLVAT